MSLCCDETKKVIDYGMTLRVGTRSDVDFFSALSPEVIARIPAEKRRAAACLPGTGGVDIHAATAAQNPVNGAYCLTVGFRELEFLFSIDDETARSFLPGHYRRYPRLDGALPQGK